MTIDPWADTTMSETVIEDRLSEIMLECERDGYAWRSKRGVDDVAVLRAYERGWLDARTGRARDKKDKWRCTLTPKGRRILDEKRSAPIPAIHSGHSIQGSSPVTK